MANLSGPLTISVRRSDIRGATPSDSSDCPIARALKRITGSQSVNVDDATIRYYDANRKRYMVADLPESAKTFVTTFDAEETVKPFEFEAIVRPESNYPIDYPKFSY